MHLWFDANHYESIFSRRSIKKAELIGKWLATWRDMDMCVRHDILYDAETSNQAEYGSLIMVLKHIYANATAIKEITDEVMIHGDSQLVISQVKGCYRVHEPDLKILWLECVTIIHNLELDYNLHIRMCWVPRETNNAALGIVKRLKEAEDAS